MKFLFNGKYAPLTDGIAFIDTSIENVLKWNRVRIEELLHIKTNIIELKTSFENILLMGLPFLYPAKEILFETKSKWTGFIQNSHRTEVGHAGFISDKTDSFIVSGEAWLSNYGKKVNGWGGGSFCYFEKGAMKRYIMLSDQDKWDFDQSGKIFPFEETEKYKERFARNRFTPEMLDRYLKTFGVEFFNEDFYMPQGSKAYIVEQVRKPYPNEISTSLEERRKELNYK